MLRAGLEAGTHSAAGNHSATAPVSLACSYCDNNVVFNSSRVYVAAVLPEAGDLAPGPGVYGHQGQEVSGEGVSTVRVARDVRVCQAAHKAL